MRIRLNGWQRIGIVLSVIWAIGGGVWGNSISIHEGDSALAILSPLRSRCYETHHGPRDWTQCEQDFDRDYSEAIKYHWHYAAVVAFVPILLAWLIVYAFISLWRWIRRGFNI
jgi:hypothetical protein